MAKYVIKSSGEKERFSIKKFKRSLRKAGARSAIIEKLTKEILERPELDTTKKIYSYAYKHLKGIDRPLAARYSLKHALYGLGPTGFYFERFVAELFKAQGYTTQVGLVIQGVCTDHEIDVIIQRDKKRFMVECKFHNRPGVKTDVKEALYTKARYDDLSAQWTQEIRPRLACDGVWLVTNTQFTSKAIDYGNCAGMELLGWAYPAKGNIAQLIDTYGLHPITSVTCISKVLKRRLLEQNILLCRDLLERPDIMKLLHMKPREQRQVENECKVLCKLSET